MYYTALFSDGATPTAEESKSQSGSQTQSLNSLFQFYPPTEAIMAGDSQCVETSLTELLEEPEVPASSDSHRRVASRSPRRESMQLRCTLRSLLRSGHASAFGREHQVADVEVVLDDARLHLIQTQLVACKSLGVALELLGIRPANNLSELIRQALHEGVITRKEAGFLKTVNQDANVAKHDLHTE